MQRTEVRYLLPFGADGLNAGLTAAATVEGVCGFTSIAALDRPDAWDCMSVDNEVLDPCFVPPMLTPGELGQLACGEEPFSTEVTLLTLTEPLVREKEAPEPGKDLAQPAGVAIDPWDLPWAVELATGDQCTLLHGTLTVMAGQVVHYGCANGGMVLGEVNHRQPVWTVNYLAEGEVASNLIDVVTAWS